MSLLQHEAVYRLVFHRLQQTQHQFQWSTWYWTHQPIIKKQNVTQLAECSGKIATIIFWVRNALFHLVIFVLPQNMPIYKAKFVSLFVIPRRIFFSKSQLNLACGILISKDGQGHSIIFARWHPQTCHNMVAYLWAKDTYATDIALMRCCNHGTKEGHLHSIVFARWSQLMCRKAVLIWVFQQPILQRLTG